MENAKLKLLLGEVALNKDQKAYRDLYLAAYPMLHRFAFSIVKSKEDAEEIVSDFLVTIWQKKEQLAELENPKLYFFVSIKNLSINKLGISKRHHAVFNEEYLVHFKSPFFNPGELFLSAEAVNKILGAINELPPKCKLIFRLIKEDGLKYSEVASLLTISIKTVEAQMAIALKRIRENYDFKAHFPEIHHLLSGKNNS